MTLRFDRIVRIDSPIGRIEITSLHDRLTSLTIARRRKLPHDDLPDDPSGVLEHAATQLRAYFVGDLHTFDLPFTLQGTAFQQRVWEHLAAVPWGEAISYGALAADVGAPGAGRAVGGAVAANPLPIFIGSHRVLTAQGKVTGFSEGRGVATKLWLLNHERILLPV